MVFSLEHQGGVIGRQSLSCRICSCPKRDKKSQENAYMKKSIQQNPDVQSPNNLPYVPLKKKPKLMYQHQHNSILKPSVIEQISGTLGLQSINRSLTLIGMSFESKKNAHL